MAKILEMPKLSPTMEEGVLSTWHKKEGDAVEVDDMLAEVETDKATMEFRAFDKGTILKLLVAPGALVKLGQPVAVLGNPGEDVSSLLAGAGGAPNASASPAPNATSAPAPAATATASTNPSPTENAASEAAAPRGDTQPGPRPASPPPPIAPTLAPPATVAATPRARGSILDRTDREPARTAPTTTGGRVMASPYVRKTARDLGIDLHGAHGTGPGGRVVPADLQAMKSPREPAATSGSAQTALTKSASPAAPPATALAKTSPLAEPEVRPLSMMRKTIARRLTESKQTVPHFYLTIDVDAGELVKLRAAINLDLANGAAPSNGSPKAEGVPALKVSINDLIIKASAAALVRVPECNAQFTPEAILVHRRVDISVAVAITEGLVTPVLRDADKKSVVAIAREVRELAARARSKKLTVEEMTGGTFSISNLGMFGIDSFSAVINPPEGAILAVGQVRDVPIVRDGAVQPGQKLAMTLSCDHRVVDGAIGAAFLAELRALIEHPMRILTG